MGLGDGEEFQGALLRNDLLNIHNLLLLQSSPPEVLTPVDFEDVIKVGSTLSLPDLRVRPGLYCCLAVDGDGHVVDEPCGSKKPRVLTGSILVWLDVGQVDSAEELLPVNWLWMWRRFFSFRLRKAESRQCTLLRGVTAR